MMPAMMRTAEAAGRKNLRPAAARGRSRPVPTGGALSPPMPSAWREPPQAAMVLAGSICRRSIISAIGLSVVKSLFGRVRARSCARGPAGAS